MNHIVFVVWKFQVHSFLHITEQLVVIPNLREFQHTKTFRLHFIPQDKCLVLLD